MLEVINDDDVMGGVPSRRPTGTDAIAQVWGQNRGGHLLEGGFVGRVAIGRQILISSSADHRLVPLPFDGPDVTTFSRHRRYPHDTDGAKAFMQYITTAKANEVCAGAGRCSRTRLSNHLLPNDLIVRGRVADDAAIH